ncbi:MAG: nitroreductase family protein [Rikenellaceae bacterium]|nr:nitroreductase family protein [Rikenellaceae bacterium]
MDYTIDIDRATCIKCGRCATVCPSSVFDIGAEREIIVSRPENCIVCGHCVAACPTFSVRHSDFPPAKVHAIDTEKLPTPEQTLLLIRSRRSNRAFTKEPVPAEKIDLILEAAHRAPTASNLQQVEYTVVTDPELLKAISTHTVEVFYKITRRINSPFIKPVISRLQPEVYRMASRLARLKSMYDAGHDMILRGAMAVIFIHTPVSSRFGCQDSNLAYQNASLMAESLGVTQFYTGFVCNALKQDKEHKLEKMLGIDGRVHAGMALGIPRFRYPNYIDKKEIKVTKL